MEIIICQTHQKIIEIFLVFAAYSLWGNNWYGSVWTSTIDEVLTYAITSPILMYRGITWQTRGTEHKKETATIMTVLEPELSEMEGPLIKATKQQKMTTATLHCLLKRQCTVFLLICRLTKSPWCFTTQQKPLFLLLERLRKEETGQDRRKLYG